MKCHSQTLQRCDNCGYFCTLPLSGFRVLFPPVHRLTCPQIIRRRSTTPDTVLCPRQDGLSQARTRPSSSMAASLAMRMTVPLCLYEILILPPFLPYVAHQCSMVCKEMGRHSHIDFCRSSDHATCKGTDIEHIRSRLEPEPTKAKDWVSHKLHWQRTGMGS